MKTENNNFAKIEAFLFGRLSAAEAAAFKIEMKNNQELAAQVAQQKMEHRSMQIMLENDLRTQMNDWEAERPSLTATPPVENKSTAKIINMQERRVKRRRLMYRLAAAASLLLLIGFFGQQYVSSNYSSQVLAMEGMATTSIIQRGEKSEKIPQTLPVSIQSALSMMEQGNYQNAVSTLENINEPDHQEFIQLLKIESYFKLGNYSRSANLSQQLIATAKDDSNRENAEWNLLLSYFAAEEKKVEARTLLDKIVANSNHANYAPAKKMKEQLDSIWGTLGN